MFLILNHQENNNKSINNQSDNKTTFTSKLINHADFEAPPLWKTISVNIKEINKYIQVNMPMKQYACEINK